VRIDRVIDAAVRSDGGAARVMRAGNQMEQVSGDRVRDEHLAIFVPVVSPGIGKAVAEDFEDFSRGMIAPDATVDRHALLFGASRGANPAGTRGPAAAIEPAI